MRWVDVITDSTDSWVWDSSGRWWRTENPALLLSMRSQGVGCNWTTKSKDLDIRPETIELLEENGDSNLIDISLTGIFVDMPPKAMETKVKKKWDYIKLKSYCTTKDITIKMKRWFIEWEKVFANDIIN